MSELMDVLPMIRMYFFIAIVLSVLFPGLIESSNADPLLSAVDLDAERNYSEEKSIFAGDISLQVGQFRFRIDFDHNNTSRENKNSEDSRKIEKDGLIAQQISASAAQEQVNVAVVQTIFAGFGTIAALGTYFIVLTLRETRRTANAAIDSAKEAANATKIAQDSLSHAREISRFDLRPWLTLDANLASGITYEEKGLRLYIRVRVTNVGKNPANQVAVIAEANNAIGLPDGSSTPYFERALSIVNVRIKSSQGNSGLILIPNEWTEQEHGVLISWEDVKRGSEFFEDGKTVIAPCIYISATYCDLSGDKIVMQTAKTFHIFRGLEGGGARVIILEDGAVPLENLGISTFTEGRVI